MGGPGQRLLTQQQQLDLLCHALFIGLDGLVQLARPRRVGLVFLAAAEAHGDCVIVQGTRHTGPLIGGVEWAADER